MLLKTDLNVDAKCFHPTHEPINLVIFNDGVPCMTLPTEGGRYDILHGIPDDTIDSNFPPEAGEAAELEDVDEFVKELSLLALLEEKEESARHGFGHFPKRWEVRRAAGPTGRPRPAMHLIVPVQHLQKPSSHNHALTLHTQARRRHVHDGKLQAHESIRRNVERRHKGKCTSMRQPIHQPRKLTT